MNKINLVSVLDEFLDIHQRWKSIYERIIDLDYRELDIDFDGELRKSYLSLYSDGARLYIINPDNNFINILNYHSLSYIFNTSNTRIRFDVTELEESVNQIKEDESSLSYIILSSNWMRELLKQENILILDLFNRMVEEYLKL